MSESFPKGMTNILTISITKSDTGLYFATCEEYRGMLVAERSFAEVINGVPVALAELIEAGAKIPSLDGVQLPPLKENQ